MVGMDITELNTAAEWDGINCVASLEASNGVTKCRGIVFAPQDKCCINGFSFHLRLKRGNGVGFVPIVGAWHAAHTRVSSILHKGAPQEIQGADFTEYSYQVPAEQQVTAGPDDPVVLGFYTEECTSHRSSSAEIGQIPSLSALPSIPSSVYLNGKLSTGTWRTYEGTLACKVSYTKL